MSEFSEYIPDPHSGVQLSPGVREIFRHARGHAVRFGHEHIAPEHLLLGLLDKGAGVGFQLILKLGISTAGLRAAVGGRVTPSTVPQTWELPLSREATRVCSEAIQRTLDKQSGFLMSEDLLFAIFEVPGTAARSALEQVGFTRERAEAALESLFEPPRRGGDL